MGGNMSEAMERIVGTYVKTRNLSALREVRIHRIQQIEALSSLKGIDPSSAVRQNSQELAIIEAGIARLSGEQRLSA
jgi:hypothetical protein